VGRRRADPRAFRRPQATAQRLLGDRGIFCHANHVEPEL